MGAGVNGALLGARVTGAIVGAIVKGAPADDILDGEVIVAAVDGALVALRLEEEFSSRTAVAPDMIPSTVDRVSCLFLDFGSQ